MQSLPISLLIPTMNRPDALERTLRSYFKADAIPAQLVVVDQSKDRKVSSEIKKSVESYGKFCKVKYIYQPMPSLTKARNHAFQYAEEEIVVCSDDDVDVYKDTLLNLFSLMSDSKIAMVGGINDRSRCSKTWVGYFLGTKSYKNRNIGHVTNSMLGRFPEQFSENVPTMWTMGFFFCIKKSLKEKWNLEWDEKLPGYAYGEDLDFSYAYYKHAKLENLECIYSTKVHVNHLVSDEYRTPSKEQTFMYILNRAYLSNKHHMGIKGIVATKWCNFFRLCERIIKKQNASDMKEAMKYYRKNKRKVKAGVFPY